jgi:hypothetical protein
MVALALVALLVVAAASVPTATAYGCYDDCYERCANGKTDPACTKMCNQACGTTDQGAPGGTPA